MFKFYYVYWGFVFIKNVMYVYEGVVGFGWDFLSFRFVYWFVFIGVLVFFFVSCLGVIVEGSLCVGWVSRLWVLRILEFF